MNCAGAASPRNSLPDKLIKRRMNKIYQVEYAGYKVRYSFLFPTTQYYFREYLESAEGEEYDIRITNELMEIGRKYLPEGSSDGYVEYRLLIERTALELLRWGCCIFHAAAFVFRGYAWLLAAPSGTGKTTQFLNWQRLHFGELEMITGDMPVIEPVSDGSVMIHSTSWCGKENLGRKGLCAPLGGIVILEQGEHNVLSGVSTSDAVRAFFRQFMVRPETDKQILALAKLAEQMLIAAPVKKLLNLGDDGSTELMREWISDRADELIGGKREKV